MTVVYISRHSQPFSDLINNYEVNELFQIRNEKSFKYRRRSENKKIKWV